MALKMVVPGQNGKARANLVRKLMVFVCAIDSSLFHSHATNRQTKLYPRYSYYTFDVALVACTQLHLAFPSLNV